MIYLSTLLLSFFITVVLIPVFCRAALRYKIGLDIPDARKVHQQPIPRVGGLALTLGVYISTVFSLPQSGFVRAYAIGAAFIVIFGLLDDLKGLDFRVKFLAQFMAALVVVIYGGIKIVSLGSLLPDGMLLPDVVAIPLTVIAIVGVTNAVNLSDGLDGLAGGISLLSFCCLGYLAYTSEDLILSLLAIALVGSIMGFLRYNTHPAELFLGDTGSQFLGFSAITMSLALTQKTTAFSPLLPVLILGFPVLDTLTVMAQRFAEKRPLFSPDKNHFHHRLMGLGFEHSESVMVIYVLQTLLVVGAYRFRFHSDWVILSTYVCLSAAIVIGFHLADVNHWKVHRYHFLEHLVKGRIRRMRDEGLFIRVFFKTIQYGLPALLFATCFVPETIPKQFSFLSLAFLGVLGIVSVFRQKWLRGSLMFVLYLFIPFVVYLGAEPGRDLFFQTTEIVYDVFYVALVVFAVLTLKLTRRKRGFKTTPMDFLILFIAAVFPYLLGTYLHVDNLPVIVAKTIIFFFGYEVLMGELRGKLRGLMFGSMLALAVVVVRGSMGW